MLLGFRVSGVVTIRSAADWKIAAAILAPFFALAALVGAIMLLG